MTHEDIPYFEDLEAPLRPGEPIVERNVVHVIVFDPKTNKVLCLDIPKFKWHTIIVGGIEDSETTLEAAKREIAEETGYVDIEFVKEVGKSRSGFYAEHKKENRIANATGMLFRLISDKKVPTNEEDAANHTCVWVPKEEVSGYINIASQNYIWSKALEVLE